MKRSWRGWCALGLIGLSVAAFAQRAEIKLDNKDLDTPYVPTPQKVVDAMLAIGNAGPQDYLIDLGSGDGRIIITAAKRLGARGFGVEIDPRLVKFANQLAREQGVADRARFFEQDLFKTDLTKASLITMYLLPDVNIELRPRLLALTPGTRIVSHDYHLGDWRADQHLVLDVPDKPVGPLAKSDIFMWVVPARVEGRWVGTVGKRALELDIRQTYQQVEAALRVDGQALEVVRASLRGPDLQILARSGDFVRLALKAGVDGLQGDVLVRGETSMARLQRRP